MKSLKCGKTKSWGGTTASGWLSITFATLALSHERYDDHTPATYSVITVTYSVITVCPFQQGPHMLHHWQLSKPEKERMQKMGNTKWFLRESATIFPLPHWTVDDKRSVFFNNKIAFLKAAESFDLLQRCDGVIKVETNEPRAGYQPLVNISANIENRNHMSSSAGALRALR